VPTARVARAVGRARDATAPYSSKSASGSSTKSADGSCPSRARYPAYRGSVGFSEHCTPHDAWLDQGATAKSLRTAFERRAATSETRHAHASPPAASNCNESAVRCNRSERLISEETQAWTDLPAVACAATSDCGVGTPYRVGLCHCLAAASIMGPVSRLAIFPRDAVTIEAKPRDYAGGLSVPAAARPFSDATADEIGVNLGSWMPLTQLDATYELWTTLRDPGSAFALRASRAIGDSHGSRRSGPEFVRLASVGQGHPGIPGFTPISSACVRKR